MKRSSVGLILIFLISLNILAWLTVYDLSQLGKLEVTFFDVGQGDAILIETPRKYQILIDGGPDETILEKLGKEMPFWDRTIELMILTHPEKDHLVGLIEVLKRYKVKNILWTGVRTQTAEYQVWKKLIEEEGAEIYLARAGQLIKPRKSALFNLRVLYPFENLAGQRVKNLNNTSIVVHLVFGDNSFLFTGDIYKSRERELIERGGEIKAKVLKIAHHGSKTSSSREFIEKVSPLIAIIQSGQPNPYGHPHQETLETLKKYDIKVLRTDQKGDIKILCNSHSLKLKLKD